MFLNLHSTLVKSVFSVFHCHHLGSKFTRTEQSGSNYRIQNGEFYWRLVFVEVCGRFQYLQTNVLMVKLYLLCIL